MKAKQFIAVALAAVTALGLLGCNAKDEKSSSSNSSNSKTADSAKEESSSSAETSQVSEDSSEAPEESSAISKESSAVSKESSAVSEESRELPEVSRVTEKTSSAAEESSKQNSLPDDKVTVSADEISFFEQFPENVYACKYETTVNFLKSAFGDTDNVTEPGEFMNALGFYTEKQFDYPGGISVLGEKFNNMSVDSDIDDKTVYTVGFHKNPDINTEGDNDPSSSDCKDSYDRLYAQFIEMYGEPPTIFTPEGNGFYGALWTDTPCGEIWLAWGEKIFDSQEADCMITFSRPGIN
ncbi:MAG: hypothetical protein J5582_03220 [Ruminococcus sp.]|uniref:hypothetical protein n=1 Tax=Ruminococcus sp. TaxID=41978 RepID=UPI0025F412B7|nr:hypothetical protein [Ruminococcus sp.]MBO4865569.1 hypothetical protein [Ruminococcus sp.]